MINEWPSWFGSGPRARARMLLGLGVICCVCAWLAMPLIDVESVLFSGPVLLIVGLVTLIYGIRHQYRPLAAIGVAHMGICILFVSLVNILGWGPGAARTPFALMGALYILIISPLSWLLGQSLPERHPFGACVHCGYLLYGLREPRCPECGQAFDPAWLPRLATLSGTAAPTDGFTDGFTEGAGI